MSSNLYLRGERASSLFGRDACSDAFGSNAMNSICAPSNTLCCVRRNQPFPSCQQYLGRGWCCVGEKDTDNCYVDGPSACEEPNAVPCTNLASGVKQACCPRLTSCHNDYEASLTQVRCNIRQIDLKRAGAATAVTTSTSSTSTTSTTTSSSSTISTNPSSSIPTQASSGIAENVSGTASSTLAPSGGGVSGGVIAGAVVGPTLVIVALVLLGCFFYRRRAKNSANKHELSGSGLQPSVAQQTSTYPLAPPYNEYKPYPASQSIPIGPDGYPVAYNAPVEVEATNVGGNYYAAELPGR
ncbi:hypothetical protein QBC43DRAFT_38572 [Cladorrhinum sp. PSN259]|nr:hypothetical protein QBC43DRAFT_38572 [Cladorrhinum sp. PSN259]